MQQKTKAVNRRERAQNAEQRAHYQAQQIGIALSRSVSREVLQAQQIGLMVRRAHGGAR